MNGETFDSLTSPRPRRGPLPLAVGALVFALLAILMVRLFPGLDAETGALQPVPFYLLNLVFLAVLAAREHGRAAAWFGLVLVAGLFLAFLGALFTNYLTYSNRWFVNYLAEYLFFYWLSALALVQLIDHVKEAGERRLVELEVYAGDLKENSHALGKAIEETRQRLPALVRRIEKYVHLNDISTQFNACKEIDELLEQALKVIIVGFGEDTAATIRLLHEDQTLVRATAPGEPVPALQTLDSHVLDNRTSLLVRDLQDDYRFPDARGPEVGIRSYMATPFLEGEKVIGLVRLTAAVPDRFATENLRFLSYLVNSLSLGYQNLRLFKKSVELSRRDGLTELYKRWYFDEALAAEVKRSRRFGKPLALIMMDIDDFRRFNNNYGHQVGDAVLKQLAAVVMRQLPRLAVAARYGGEEIAVILPETDLPPAVEIAERLRIAVERDARVASIPEAVTLSAGVAALGLAHEPTELIAAADQALYRAKGAGKNRTEVAS